MGKHNEQTIGTLIAARPEVAASVFVALQRPGLVLREGPIRLKDLLARAEKRLVDQYGIRRPEAQKILSPALKRVEDRSLWDRPERGVAFFLRPDQYHEVFATEPFYEQVVVARQFYTKPLMAPLRDQGFFFVLALSRTGARLVRCTRYTAEDVDSPAMAVRPPGASCRRRCGATFAAGTPPHGRCRPRRRPPRRPGWPRCWTCAA